jgi:hypothetical protein
MAVARIVPHQISLFLVMVCYHISDLLFKLVKNKFLFTITAYHGQTLTQGQLCTTLWDSQ